MRRLRFSQLERFRIGGTPDRMELSVPMPKSPSGKVYQYSPNPAAASRLFLIGEAPEERRISEKDRTRVRREPGPGFTVCPYSGHIAEDDAFIHAGDVEAIQKHVLWMAENDIGAYLSDLAKDFNHRQPRGGLVTMSMDYKGSRRPRPLAIREDLLRSLDCDVCSRSYGVYALALFCPDCGSPNVALHFRREIELVDEQIVLADQLSEQGRVELAYRLMGNAHEDVLTALEATLKTVHAHLVRTYLPSDLEKLTGKKAVGNSFQNLDRARQVLARIGVDPFAGLGEGDLDRLRLNIQKRHVLGHNLGVADEHYAGFAEELEPGETVTLIGDEIRAFATLCLNVVETLEDALLPGFTMRPRVR